MSTICIQLQSACDWQPTVADRTCCLCLPEWLKPLNCVNCDKPSYARTWTPPGRWSRLSLPVTWTGTTHCTTASLTSWCEVCSRCRTLWPGWSLAHDDATTSHRCFASCTGFQCRSASTTTSSRLFIGVCPATSQATWLTTADSSPTPASDDCVLPTLELTLVVGRTQSSFGDRTFISLPQHLGSGTVCRLI